MRFGLALFMSFISLSAPLFGKSLEIGAPAPQVQATDHLGDTFDLAEQVADGITLVFFYPKAFTPGCTSQACSLRDSWDELSERGVGVFGVSSDTVKTQARFREKHNLPFTLIADTEREVAKAFGRGRWSRQAYLFKDGKVVWRDLSAPTKKQAAEALAALDALQSQ